LYQNLIFEYFVFFINIWFARF